MNLSEWRPQESIIKNIEDTLQLALVPNSDAQKTVQDRLILMQNLTDFPNYLLFILGNPGFSEDIRSLSGILLKNNIQSTYNNLSQENTLKIKNECLRLLKDPSREVRISISNIIVIIAKDHLKTWPELVPFLTKGFVAQDEYSEVALTSLFKVCEELINSQKPQEEIYKITKEVFPKFVEFVGVDKCMVRQNIVRLTNQFLQDYFAVMKQSIDLGIYLRNVMQLANTDDLELQKCVCHTFVIYIDNHEETLLPHLHDIICYLLEKCHHEDQDVALQACEFWLASTKINTCKDILTPYIEKLLPTLLKNMRYSDSELNMIKDSLGSDANKKDLTKDISPFHFRDRNNGGEGEEYYSDEEAEDQSDDFDDFYVGWTLRKCSAASLDSIAVKFGDEILPLLIPLISEMLQNPDHLVKESAILALGAIAEGCFNGLKSELPELVQFLIHCMNDEHSVVRVITCWTLSRYVSWIVNVRVDNPEEYFVPVMTILLKHFVDENKRVQRAAISAFCIFQEEAQLKLIPYIDFILEGFKYGFEQFHCRSLYLLYDAIGVLAQSVGNHLSKDEFVTKLLPPLMSKFTELKNFYDDHFIAVLECLSNVIPALEVSFLPYSEIVYWHCLQLINDTLIASVNYQQNPNEYDPPDKEPMNVAHDVLYSMALGLKTHFVKYVTNSNLIYLLYTTMQDSSNLIRQTSIALYGELIGLCYPFLDASVKEYIPLIIRNLDEHTDGVCNNAAWVIGKLCSVMGTTIQPFLPEILNAFVHILRTPAVARTMHKTVAISLCIVFFVCPDVTVPDMDVIVKNCCMLVRNVRDSDEKDLAFRGLCEVIIRHPEFNKNYFIFFCDAAASWINIRMDLKQMVRNVLMSFKQQCGEENWRQFYTQFPEALKLKLQEIYGNKKINKNIKSNELDLWEHISLFKLGYLPGKGRGKYSLPRKCPPNLFAPLIKIVIEEIRKACKKHPINCGFNPGDNAYEPLKLMQTVMAKTNEVCLRYLDNSMLCSLPSPDAGSPYCLTSVFAIKNTRRRMEDRHVVVHDLNTMFGIQEASPSSYYAVFDGHAGHDAAAYSSAHLHQFLAENKYFVSNPKQALLDAFCKTDALFIDKCKVEHFSSGSTAVVALLRPKEKMLYVAWAGDSQALLVSRDRAFQLVNPHKPCREDERERIEKRGGCVMKWGTWRVNGQLAVSRAIGDPEYKPFVIAIPDIQEISLDGDDFLVLACDGLWDSLSEESVARAVYNLVMENSDDTDRISQRLVHLAKEQGSTDNISVIVVFLREPSKIAAEAHWANRNLNPATMEEGFNNANNPFGVTNGSTTDNIIAPTDGLLLNLSDKLKQNGTDLSPSDDFFEKSNGKRSASEFDDEDFGPETDVDTVDDFSSPGLKDEVAKSFADGFPSPNNNPLLDEGVFNPFMEHQEKAALEMEKNMRKRETNDEFDDDELMAREETPTPPADVVHDVSGLVENPGDSESEDEWNYIKGDDANKENISPQPEKEVADIPEEDDTMSQLNPNAAEFVPVSPTRSIPSPACRMLINDPIVSQSPKKANEVDINLPNPEEFENEVKSRPCEVDVYNNGHKDDDDHDTSKDLMENMLNGKNIDEIPEFQPGSTPKKVFQNDEFHFGPNAAPFSPKLLDQSEALSTKALFGDESEATVDISFNESINRDILNKESDPMSMSFYADKGDNNPFDLNKVQQLPDNLDDFIKQPDNETFNETISDLPEHNPLGDLKNNDDAIQITDLDKQAYDDEKELASPLEPEKELLNTEEADFSKTPEPTSECLLEEFCKLPEEQKLIINIPEDLSEVSDLLRSEPENLPPDVELLPNFDLPPSEPLKLSDTAVEITNLPVEPKPVFEKESLVEECCDISNQLVSKLPSELFEGLQAADSVVCDNSENPDLISISQPLPEQPQAVSPLCDRPESMSSVCDLSESKSPMPEEPTSAGSEDYTRPEFIQEAQDRFEELCKPLESPQEEVTSSVKDDLSEEHEDAINVIPNQNDVIEGDIQEDVEEKPLEILEEILPSPIENLVLFEAPPPKMCVYPIKTREKEEYIPFDVKTENILPEFAEPTIVTPSEESRTEEMIIGKFYEDLRTDHVSRNEADQKKTVSLCNELKFIPQGQEFQIFMMNEYTDKEHVEEPNDTQKVALELEAEMTAIGVTSTIATGAAITAVLSESKVEEKKPIEKKQERKSSEPPKKTPIRETLKDRIASTTSKSSIKRATSPKSPLKAPTSKTGLNKTTPTRPKTTPITSPPLKKQPIKSVPKMTNGETKTSAKPLAARKPLETSAKLGTKPTTAATATLRGTQNKPTTKPPQITVTKTATSRPIPPVSARPAPITKRPPPLSKSHSGAIEKASVTAKQLSAVKPKPATTVLSKPKPTSTVIQPPPKGRLTLTKDKSKTLPDTEKQIKENVNKITASRTVTQRTGSAPVRSSMKSTTVYQKSTVNSARTTVMKSTTANVKTTTLTKKKPTEVVKTTAATKTKTTKIEKPKENGISTVITEEITVVNNATLDQKNEINLIKISGIQESEHAD